jgi:choline dehydrogenase-like flavoprotein
MHSDLDQSSAAAPQPAQICIVGAGVAGLILARQLAARGLTVHLLEAGGLDIEEQSQALNRAEMAQTVHLGTTEGRFRALGGSSTRWGGQLLPYTDDVFHSVPGSPTTPWPIDDSAFARYYGEAETLMHAGSLPFTDALPGTLGHAPQPVPRRFRVRYSKWAPFAFRNLGHTLGPALRSHPRVHLWTHANVAELCARDGRVTHARVLNFQGQQFTFYADIFIVAAGTIESSRLLLSSPDVPNPHDQLGRYFHDHLSFCAAVVPEPARAQVLHAMGPFFANGVLYTCKIEAGPEMRRELGLMAVMAHFTIEEPGDSGIAAVRNLLSSVQRGALKEAATRNLLPMLRGIGDVARLLWATKVRRRRALSKRAILRLYIDMEQASDPSSRIRLSDTTDALGLRKAVVDWHVGEPEYDNALRYAHLIKAGMEEAGFAPFTWIPGLLQGERPRMLDTYHAMGGLRMGHDPSHSVVDPNLKVHGLENLYVAGCAVYPSGGSSNPTFTLMALSMRLADHLTDHLAAIAAGSGS